MQKGIVFLFASALDRGLVRNYGVGGFKKGVNGFCSRLYSCLKLPEMQVFAYKLPKWQAVALRKCKLARHKGAGLKT